MKSLLKVCLSILELSCPLTAYAGKSHRKPDGKSVCINGKIKKPNLNRHLALLGHELNPIVVSEEPSAEQQFNDSDSEEMVYLAEVAVIIGPGESFFVEQPPCNNWVFPAEQSSHNWVFPNEHEVPDESFSAEQQLHYYTRGFLAHLSND